MENPNGSYQSATEQEEQKKRTASTGLKVTVLLILIILLAIGILLPIKLVPNAVSSIATSITSLFVPNKEVKITADKTVINTGEQFTISWTGSHQTNGSYSLTYECAPGLRVETSVNQPNETITCGTPYYFSPNTNSIDLTAFSETDRYSDVKMTLGFLENGATKVDAVADKIVTITNQNISDNLGSATPTTTKPVVVKPVKPTPSTPVVTPTQPISNPHGLADLEIRPIAVGYLNGSGTFVPSTSISAGQVAAIKFAIVNIGDKNSGSFTFSADLPSSSDPHYNVGDQASLHPGERIEYILSFKNIQNVGDNVATIYVDKSNFVPESSKANNVLQVHINNGTSVSSTNGKSDLAVQILDTGIVNRSTNVYTPSSSVTSSDRVGVRFLVTNNGTEATGAWKFSAVLPTSNSNAVNYTSDTEPSIGPGEHYTFTINFDNIVSVGNNTATITIDPTNQVYESNESNNTASAVIYRNY